MFILVENAISIGLIKDIAEMIAGVLNGKSVAAYTFAG
jgi:hypothetical protein